MVAPHDSPRDPLARYALTPAELQEVIAAERSGTPCLVFRDGDGRLRVFAIDRPMATITVGRRPGMDLSISWDGEVSGLHAELHGYVDEWTIDDDGLSTNGTFVNGHRVAGRVRLRHGDRIRVGQTVLAFIAGVTEQPKSTVSAGETATAQTLTDTQRKVLIALCRPYRDGDMFATPATNQQIAGELFRSVDAVKMHLRTLFAKFELTDYPPNEKRSRLAETALQFGVISQRELHL